MGRVILSRTPTPKDTRPKAALALADGTVLRGFGFGAVGKTTGEVVFNTGMVGYPEAITDPSYKGQILTQTYPLIGNYGVSLDNLESEGPKIQGYVVHEFCNTPSHWASKMGLDEWLAEYEVPGIEGVDTRLLTKRLRVEGVMMGALWVFEEGEKPTDGELRRAALEALDPNMRDLVSEVATDRVLRYKGSKGGRTVGLIDCGVKMNIVRNLLNRGLNVVQFPPRTSAKEILEAGVEGVVVSNGPGDPKMIPYTVETVRGLLAEETPLLGICLGAQILALAYGGSTYKLKFGHRGQNHPVLDLEGGRCYITSQNHGYAVENDSLKGTELEATLLNLNDKTVEGLRDKRRPVLGVQFHPEASPGPEDTGWIFDWFTGALKRRGE